MQGPRGVIKSCFVIKHGRRHHFPNPTKYEDMFQKWLHYCDKEILTLPPDQVYKNRSVCSVHSTAEQFGSNNKLTAYPTLNIPNVQSLFDLYGEIPMLSLVEIVFTSSRALSGIKSSDGSARRGPSEICYSTAWRTYLMGIQSSIQKCGQ